MASSSSRLFSSSTSSPNDVPYCARRAIRQHGARLSARTAERLNLVRRQFPALRETLDGDVIILWLHMAL